ncbi:indole-3-glycerol phosphate synthase TrpC [Oscillatoria salina]|uniref:indole-3-glycerol phosphate synthase TrpC n=1 Tax=Oscillatoria salina TaxID=331517 RepID=UPI0013BC86D7|nr:indole-3-glycerol phosphate synthase TrpC [Oscillatoria salina]MBZ8179314.1 indole-3-glycerol phosphate synthase TrpC [Oscillatoria salina IIICB1]NET87652.1 indole-3-glycerol phosphate synthase TrpC [Kamptonema sp. SIO1D9]
MQIRRRSPNPPVDIKYLRYQVALPDAEPRNILEKIVWHKETEVDKMRDRLPLLELRKQLETAPPVRDFLAGLRSGKTKPALIAEVKKASPSKGVIREDFDPVAIATAYQQAGASCISVLSDREFFQGSYENITLVRSAVDLPILCKEFIIYPYQIYLARAHGADAVLLIAAILSEIDLGYFLKITRTLGMAALVEVHSLEELDRVLAVEGVNLVGINNRNLEDFSVDLQTTSQLLELRGKILKQRGITLVSESGLHQPSDLHFVSQAGADAVLIGESIVKQSNPVAAIANLFADV